MGLVLLLVKKNFIFVRLIEVIFSLSFLNFDKVMNLYFVFDIFPSVTFYYSDFFLFIHSFILFIKLIFSLILLIIPVLVSIMTIIGYKNPRILTNFRTHPSIVSLWILFPVKTMILLILIHFVHSLKSNL